MDYERDEVAGRVTVKRDCPEWIREAWVVQLFGGTLRKRIAAGVKIGISVGISKHQTCGLAMNRAAAASMATTTQSRTAILFAH
jgi:hypothetical protein